MKSTYSSGNKSWLDCIPGLRGDDERQGFVKKVYSLVFFMLLVPTFMIFLTIRFEPLRLFMINNLWLYFTCAILTFVMLISLLCFYGVLKRVPTNYIYLLVFTLLESYTVTTATCFYQPRYIIYAAILTIIMATSLTLYACFTKTDLTGIVSTLFWVSLGVSLGAIIMMAVVQSDYLVIILSWVFLILAALYLIVDTQLIVGGRYAQLSLDDYIIGAMILFIDFVLLFLNLLTILGGRR